MSSYHNPRELENHESEKIKQWRIVFLIIILPLLASCAGDQEKERDLAKLFNTFANVLGTNQLIASLDEWTEPANDLFSFREPGEGSGRELEREPGPNAELPAKSSKQLEVVDNFSAGEIKVGVGNYAVTGESNNFADVLYERPDGRAEIILHNRFYMLHEALKMIGEEVPLSLSVNSLEIGQMQVIMERLWPAFERGELSFLDFPLGLPWEGLQLEPEDPGSQNAALEEWAAYVMREYFPQESSTLGSGAHDVAVVLASPNTYQQLLDFIQANGEIHSGDNFPGGIFSLEQFSAGFIEAEEQNPTILALISCLQSEKDELAQRLGFENYFDYISNVTDVSMREDLQSPLLRRLMTIEGIEVLFSHSDFRTYIERSQIDDMPSLISTVMSFTALHEFGLYALAGVELEINSENLPVFRAGQEPLSQQNRALLEFKYSQLVFLLDESIRSVVDEYRSDGRRVNPEGELTDEGYMEALILFCEYYEPIRGLSPRYAHPEIYSNLVLRSRAVNDHQLNMLTTWFEQFANIDQITTYVSDMHQNPEMHNWDFAIVSRNNNPQVFDLILHAYQEGTSLPSNIFYVEEVGDQIFAVYGDFGWSKSDPNNFPGIQTIQQRLANIVGYYQ